VVGYDKSVNWTGWTRDLFFPLATLACLLAVVMALVLAFTTFGSMQPPGAVRGFSWTQLRFLVALFSLVVVLSYIVNTRDTEGIETTLAIGYWVTLLATFCLFGAALVELLGLEERAAARAQAVGAPTMYPGAPGPMASMPVPPPPAGRPGVAGGAVMAPAPPAPAGPPPAVFTPYWFYVDHPVELTAFGGLAAVGGHLEPGGWYLAKREESGWVETEDSTRHDGWVPVAAAHRQ
jgi:hypothetical protein